MAKRRRYQRGWIDIEGPRGRRRYVGRYRADDGTQPKLVLGLVADMTLSEARAKVEAHVRSLGSRRLSTARLTLLEFWEQSYKPRRRVRWGEATAAGYESYINAYLKPTFGNVYLQDIDTPMVANFFEKLRQGHTRTVVLKCWTLLKSILEGAIDDELILRHPMRKLPLPKTKIPSKPTLIPQLIATVLKAVNSNAFVSALLHVGVFCAVRTSEVLGLRWRSFCDDHFLIRDSAWKGKLLEDATKTGERRVAIPPATREALLRWREQCKDPGPDALIFASKRGTPISAHNLRNRVLKPLRDKLGLSVPLTFQVLRRSHATRNQRTPKDAQAHLGHKSIVTTMDIYAQEIPDSVREMVAQDEAAVLRFETAKPSGKKGANRLRKSEVAPKLLPSQPSHEASKYIRIKSLGA